MHARCYLDGAWVDTPGSFPVHDPATGKQVGKAVARGVTDAFNPVVRFIDVFGSHVLLAARAMSSYEKPSTSRRMSTARWRAGRCWSAAMKASSTLSRSSYRASGPASPSSRPCAASAWYNRPLLHPRKIPMLLFLLGLMAGAASARFPAQKLNPAPQPRPAAPAASAE